jgi:heme exporter protein A
MEAQERQREAVANQVRRETEWLGRKESAQRRKSRSRIGEAADRRAELAELNYRTQAAGAAGIDFAGTGRQSKKLLTATAVGKSLGGRTLFAALDITLSPGTKLGLLGPNGSGKSTLLRVLCGLQRPTGGQVRYRSETYIWTPDQARQLVGWVAPDLQLYRELTALENLSFFADLRGLRRSRGSLERLLDEVGLGGRGEDLLAAYSSGMAQRLRYAYALLHDPPVLLLDEPTVTLDDRGAALVEQIVNRQRGRGITVIATNDPRELRFGDYVLRLAG